MLATRDIALRRPGAQVDPGGVHYRVWAPEQRSMEVFVDRAGASRRLPLQEDGRGYWSVLDSEGRAGDLYRFRLSEGIVLPDVASRFQPEGVHGRSECIDPLAYAWQRADWRRPGWRGQTTYELHLGTFSAAGTFRSAIPQLARLRKLGVEAIELMPVADFAGNRNWGYDGAALSAPARCYGRPDDLRALVDAAHGCELAVILDVVYNHVGPQGNYLPHYCADYFRKDRETPWGRAFNLDGDRSGPVREFLTANAAAWLDEFRLDGLRLDATHAIADSSPHHLLEEIAELAHARGAFVIAEDERNSAQILRPSMHGGCGIDAAWADDFHHQVRVALTGIRTAHFAGYQGTPADLAETLAHGWTYRGQPYPPWQGRPRGSPCADLSAKAFVVCIENHDQVGNRAFGERLEHLVSPEQFRAASMLLCLGPYPPLIFMGQEWAASTPFLYFCNHGGELGRKVSEGRKREFQEAAAAAAQRAWPDPEALSSFADSKLRWEEQGRGRHAETWELYRECLRERRALSREAAFERGTWTAQAGGAFIAVRYRLTDGERMLVVSLREGRLAGADLPGAWRAAPGRAWREILASEERRFGGHREIKGAADWTLEGPGALWLAAEEKGATDAAP